MNQSESSSPKSQPAGATPIPQSWSKDLVAGLVVFLVALPLCLGIALASGAPLMSGVVAGIVGGLVVGSLSGSHTSVSGPAAGLTAVVLAQIAALGSFEAFLLAVMFAGVIQIGLGLARAGILTTFVPTSVIKGLLAAIGVILILKQFPHVFGHDTDPEGEMSFEQPDHENTFTELLAIIDDLHIGAAVIGVVSLALLVAWMRIEWLEKSRVPAPLAVVGVGLGLNVLFSGISLFEGRVSFDGLGEPWSISSSHLVQVPLAGDGFTGLLDLLTFPDFSQWSNPAIYTAAVTIAIVASLESLLNLEAVDKLDPQQRNSPPNRELWAQGAGNIVSGLLGGLPVTSVIIRGSVNIHTGATSKRSAVFHGILLVIAVVLLPTLINRIPLSCLAAILLVTGFKLASPALIKKMYTAGRDQFIPFAATVVGIVFTDLLIGLGIGMAVALGFILSRQSRRPVRQITEHHLTGDLTHIELTDQVSFLNQMGLERVFDQIPRGGRVMLDARHTEYIDPDVLAMINDFRDIQAPARGIKLSMIGFHEQYNEAEDIQEVDYTVQELRERIKPIQALDILRTGNERFVSGQRINRDLNPRLEAEHRHRYPLATVLSCIDSRVPAEVVFDMGPGDIFSVRVVGGMLGPQVLGSLEYGTAVAGSRLLAVVGHTNSGVFAAAVEKAKDKQISSVGPCAHLDGILDEIGRVCELDESPDLSGERKFLLVDEAVRRNTLDVVHRIVERSEVIAELVKRGQLAIVAVIYDLATGKTTFLTDQAIGLDQSDTPLPELVESAQQIERMSVK